MGMHSMHRVAAPSVRMSLRTRLKKCIGVLSFFDYFWQEPIFFRQLPPLACRIRSTYRPPFVSARTVHRCGSSDNRGRAWAAKFYRGTP